MDWDTYFMNLLAPISSKSKDKHTKVGAIIVGPNNEIRSTGYNSPPRGMDDSKPERFERPEKYFWIEHAERNAIYNAARCGTQTEGCRLYVDFSPCIDCARAIVQSGIREVIVQRDYTGTNPQQWEEQFARVKTLFAEAGVKMRYAK